MVSASQFAYFFLGEYTNIIVISTLFSIVFVGVCISFPLVFVILWIRASFARLRFDQLVDLGWSHLLPFSLAFVFALPLLLFSFDF